MAYSEKLNRIEIFLLLRLVGSLNGFGGGRRTRIDTVRLLELTFKVFATQPLVFRDDPPAQNGEDGSSAKDDHSLWIPQNYSNHPIES